MSPGPTPVGGLPPLPRPGPDPIPWPEPTAGLGLLRLIGIGLAAGLILLMIVRAARRWAHDRRARAAIPVLPPPGARADELAAAARSALVAMLGEPWGARTTEELAESEATLRDAFGDDLTAQLLAFLRETDQVRFADRDELADSWRPAVAALLDTARSMRTGR
jgi:hypothetical protein